MLNRIRAFRKTQGLTLADVAARCTPPTTAVTIGRLETGMRQLTVPWLERIATALSVDPKALLADSDESPTPVAAVLGPNGADAPHKMMEIHLPTPASGAIGLVVRVALGGYQAGDRIWLEQLPPARFAEALHLDVLAPRPVGRFVFGRLLARTPSTLTVLPLQPGATPVTVENAPWIARPTLLVRSMPA